MKTQLKMKALWSSQITTHKIPLPIDKGILVREYWLCFRGRVSVANISFTEITNQKYVAIANITQIGSASKQQIYSNRTVSITLALG